MIKLLKGLLRLVYVLYAFLLFVALMIPVFIWSLLVLPLGRIRAGNLIYYACRLWADLWIVMVFIHHRNIHLEPFDPSQSFIYVSNHISYLDSALIPKMFRQPVRPLGKIEMARIPIFGFIYKNVIVTVDRSSAEHRIKSVRILKSVLSKGISVLVFPEGTFNTTHQALKPFYDGAFRIALETGTPIKPVIILNSYDLMHYSSIFSLQPGKSKAIFLPAVNVEGLGMNDLHILKTRVHDAMEKAIVEWRGSWVRQL